MFRPYSHVERYGNKEVEGIEIGTTYIFPKLDGTNASVWLEYTKVQNGAYEWVDGPPCIKAGSRTRQLDTINPGNRDNAGFAKWVMGQQDAQSKNITQFLDKYRNLRLYGEWLVPHTVKTYREDAWRRFYIFDVWDEEKQQYLPYDVYQSLLDEFKLDYVAPIAIFNNGSPEQFYRCLEKNNWLIKDGEGIGEGIVIKNYSYVNRYGNYEVAKMITSAFKEENHKIFGAPIMGGDPIELQIAQEFVTKHLVDKVYAKIENEMQGWKQAYIPRLLETVFHDLVTEEIWNIIRKYKTPSVNFKALKAFSIGETKKHAPDVF